MRVIELELWPSLTGSSLEDVLVHHVSPDVGSPWRGVEWPGGTLLRGRGNRGVL